MASAFVLVAVLIAQVAPANVDSRQKQLADLLAEHWEYTMRTNPEYASVLGDKRYNDKITDFSEKAIYADIEAQKQFLARFLAIDVQGFPEQDALNHALMVRQISVALEGLPFKDWEMPVSQFGGIHINAPQLVSLLSFETVKDYDDYIARLRLLPIAFAQTTELMRTGRRRQAGAAADPPRAGGAPVGEDRRRGTGNEPLLRAGDEDPSDFLRGGQGAHP